MAKILISDDSKPIADLLSIILTRQHHEVICCPGNDKLLKSLTDFIPDLLILDIVYNQESGTGLCKKIKAAAAFKYIPILLTSTNAAILKNFGGCDADDVLEKPFDIHTLVEKIDVLLLKQPHSLV